VSTRSQKCRSMAVRCPSIPPCRTDLRRVRGVLFPNLFPILRSCLRARRQASVVQVSGKASRTSRPCQVLPARHASAACVIRAHKLVPWDRCSGQFAFELCRSDTHGLVKLLLELAFSWRLDVTSDDRKL
jgi:hypothetical protein